MLNQVILVGRVEMIDLEYQFLQIRVQKKGAEDILINCSFGDTLANSINGVLSTNDIVGIKGCLNTIENELIVEIEKLSFLSSTNK